MEGLAPSVWVSPQSTEVISTSVGVNEPMGGARSSKEVYHGMQEGMKHAEGEEKQH